MSSCRGFRLFPARRRSGKCRPALFKDLGGRNSKREKNSPGPSGPLRKLSVPVPAGFLCRRHSAPDRPAADQYVAAVDGRNRPFRLYLVHPVRRMLCDAPVRPEPRDAPVLQSAQMGGQPVPVHRRHHLALLFAHHGVGRLYRRPRPRGVPVRNPGLGLGFGHGLPCLPLELPADGHPHRSGERHQVHPERRDS